MDKIKQIMKGVADFLMGSTLLYKTKWYKSFFVDYNHQIYPNIGLMNDYKYDIVNLGSSAAKWAFNYKETDINGANWAQQPQTLLEDLNLLKCFHPAISGGGMF